MSMNGISYMKYSVRVIVGIPLVFFLLSQMSFKAAGQIPAPELLCVSKDTIIWNIPQVTCGAVEVYELYMSTEADGPFEKRVVVVNPQQRKYYDQNSSGETRYYYMKTLADCPGMTSESSDTINNIPPPQIPISRVTVEGGDALIEWKESSDDKVRGYIIYKSTSSGTIPIDTAFNTSYYLDTDADVMRKSEYYYVLSMDDCGNPSLFDVTHRTIFAEAKVDSCARAIVLDWNEYQGWEEGLSAYQVFLVDENGGNERLLGSVEPDQITYTVRDIEDDQQYCFQVKAIHVDGRLSASQTLCIRPQVARPIKYIEIYSVSVGLDNSVTIQWEWNEDAQLSGALVNGFTGDSGAGEISMQHSVVPQLSSQETITDLESDPTSDIINYYVSSSDVCDTMFTSEIVSTIHFDAITADGLSVDMEWSEFTIEKSSDVQYFVERILGGQVVETIPVNSLFSDYKYTFDPNDIEIYESCYRLGVSYRYTFQDGSSERQVMYSNRSCPSFEIVVQVPNAMVYQGVNDEFRPVFLTPKLIEEYSMEIYSRTGQRLFHTEEVLEGWDGTFRGQILPQGSYVYKISAKKQGHVKSLRGNLLLLH